MVPWKSFAGIFDPIVQFNNFQLGTILPPREHLVMSGTSVFIMTGEGVPLESMV